MELALSFFVLVVLAMLFGTIEHNRGSRKVRALRKFFKRLQIIPICISLVVVYLAVIVSLTSFNIMELKTHNQYIPHLLFLICFLAFFLAIKEYSLLKMIKNKWKLFVLVSSLIGLLFSAIVGIQVDAEIEKYTKLDASYFPNAQNIIFIVLVPFFAILVSFYLVGVIYFLHAISEFLKMLSSGKYLKGVVKGSVFVIFGIKINRSKEHDPTNGISILIGLFIYILYWPSQFSNIVNSEEYSIDKFVAKTLTYSSYHLIGNEVCSNITEPDIKIALLKKDLVSASKLMSDGTYKFTKGVCSPFKIDQL